MRPISFADLEVALRVLLSVDEGQRECTMATLIEHAHVADRYRKSLGRPHPEFGSGTLMSAAQGFDMQSRSAYLATEELDAVAVIVKALLARRSHQFA